MDRHPERLDEWLGHVRGANFRLIVQRLAAVLGQQFGPDGSVYVSKFTLAELSDLSDSSVKRALNELIDAGYVERTVEEGEMLNLYSMGHPYDIPEPDPEPDPEPAPE